MTLQCFDRTPTCHRQTDRQKDIQHIEHTHDDSIYRASMASGGKNALLPVATQVQLHLLS